MRDQHRWRVSKSTGDREPSPPSTGLGKAIAWLFAILAGLFGLFIAYTVGMLIYADWSAERKAREFCESTLVGSNISEAIARAADEDIMQDESDHGVHTFMFPGNGFDNAYCYVSADRQGKVVSSRWEMLYD